MLTELAPIEVPPAAPRRLRRRWLKLLRAVAAVLLVGGLSFGMVAMDSRQAEANAGLLLAPALAGAAEGALPLAAWLGAVTPLGWVIIGGVAIAAGLYYTKDYWLPYVNGDFGKAEANKNATPGTGVGAIRPGLRLLACTSNSDCPAVVSINAYVYQLNVHYGGTDTVSTYRSDGLAATIRCREPNGNVYTDKRSFTVVYGTNASDGANWNDREAPVQIGCRSVNDTKLGVTAGVHGGSIDLAQVGTTSPSNLLGPENIISYGDLLGTAFDPASPQTKYTSTVECIKPDGTKFDLTAESTGDQKAVKVPSCAAAVPGSHGTGKTTVVGTPPVGSGAPAKTLYTTPALTGTPYPKCEPGVPGNGCVLSISIDGKPCVVGEWQCAHWIDLKTEAPARLQCNYGPYLGIAIDTCNPLERAYETGGTVLNEPNTDGNPSTRNDTDPAGNPINRTDLGTGTSTGTLPGGSGQLQPGADSETVGCFPSGFAAFNPVEWVLQPIRCAFTPKPDTQTEFTQRMQNRINSVGFAPISTAWLAAYQNVGGGSGCSGPTVNFQMNGVHQTLQPFQACTEPMSTVAGIANGVATVGIVLFGGLAMVRAIGAAFGFNFSMGGKSDGD